MDIYQHFYNGALDIVLSGREPAIIDEALFQYLLQMKKLQLQIRLLGPQLSGVATVLEGPFKGMKIIYPTLEGAFLPKVIGCYEQELHPFFLSAAKKGYTHFVDIGCGDGYYVSGIALLMPHIKIDAYDINPKAQKRCKEMAELNDVAQRVTMHGAMEGGDFAKFLTDKTLILCDIEGDEKTLLDPVKYPALKHLDIVVEMHEMFLPGESDRFLNRFKATHHIQYIEQQGKQFSLPDHMKSISELDRLILSCEMRGTPTPWAIMTAIDST